MTAEQSKTNVVQASNVIKSLHDVMGFIERQQKHIKEMQMIVNTLTDSNNALVPLYQHEKFKNEHFDKILEDVDKMRQLLQTEIQTRDKQIANLSKDVAKVGVKASTIKQWIEELKDRFIIELNVLLEDNARLQVDCGMLNDRLKVLEDVERHMKSSIDSYEVDVEAVLMPKANLTVDG